MKHTNGQSNDRAVIIDGWVMGPVWDVWDQHDGLLRVERDGEVVGNTTEFGGITSITENG